MMTVMMICNNDDILPLIRARSAKRKKTLFCGYRVVTASRKLTVLKRNQKCSHCGIKGTIWKIQKDHIHHIHLALYGLNENGDHIIFTMDHIIPKSRGGGDHPKNLQTLCTICNQKKGRRLESEISL